MVKASVGNQTQTFDLKTCDGGKIILRRMTYGQKLERIELATRQVIKTETDNRGRPSNNNAAEMDIKMLQRAVAEYEFSHCISDHNLTDDNDIKMDFSKPQTLDILDPRVGDEISQYIQDMNNFDETEPGNS
jgi:hypothetical protein